MLLLGFPEAYVEINYHLYTNMYKSLKIAGILGQPTLSYSGIGQGDVASTFPVLAHASGQFFMLSQCLPNLRMGAIIDDRNFRGTFHDTIEACRLTIPYDRMSGHTTQHEKTVVITTSNDDRLRLNDVRIDGFQPKHVTHAVIVGDLITTQTRKATMRNTTKMQAATKVAHNIGKSPISNHRAQLANQTAVIP